MLARIDDATATHQHATDHPHKSLALVLVFVAVLSVLGLGLARALDYGGRDDAFITYRYARNLADGHGLVFNSGQRVEGYSAFLWALQLAAVAKLGGEIESWAVWLGGGCHVLCIVGVAWAVGRRLCPAPAAQSALAVGILGASSAPLLYYAVSGMETAEHTALVTAGVMGAALAVSRRGVLLGILCGVLAGISRPEGPALVGVVALVLAARRDLPVRQRVGYVAVLAIAGAVIIGGQYIWRHGYYGSWFPNTFYAKVAAPDASIIRAGFVYAVEFLLGSLLVLWLPVWWFVRGRSQPAWTVAVVLVLVMHVGFAWAVGGDFMPMARFIIPALPVLIAALVQACGKVGERASLSQSWWMVAAAVCIGLCSAGVFHRLEYRSLRAKSNVADYRMAGTWLARQAQPDDTVALTAIGVIPYYARIDAYDFFGLIEKSVARSAAWADLPPGHRRTDGAYIFSRRPTYILIQPRGRNIPPTEEQYVAEMVGFPGLDQLLAIPEFTYQYRYAVVRITPPAAAHPLYLALYVRRDVDLLDEVEPMNLTAIKRWLRTSEDRRRHPIE
jgi:hypothetical protein